MCKQTVENETENSNTAAIFGILFFGWFEIEMCNGDNNDKSSEFTLIRV